MSVGVGFLFKEGEEESRVALKCLITVPQEYINHFCSFDLIFPSIITNMVFSLQHGTLSISTVAGMKNSLTEQPNLMQTQKLEHHHFFFKVEPIGDLATLVLLWTMVRHQMILLQEIYLLSRCQILNCTSGHAFLQSLLLIMHIAWVLETTH